MRRLIFLAKLVLGLSIIGLSAGLVYAATPSFFAPIVEPIGVAAAPGKLLVSRPFCGSSSEVVSIDSAGTVSPFAQLLSRAAFCSEEYIAISPGLGGFPANHVYVTQGPNIVKITPDGSSVTLFATIPSLPPTHNGITFDHVGSFGNDMIVAGSNGQVWRVNFMGVATFVATVPAFIEGPDVAPPSFGPFGGQVLVASETASTVFAVSPSGVVSTVATWFAAESVHFIPSNVCSFGTSGGAFFTAIFPTHITKFPPSDLTGLGGSALVTSEFGGGIGLLTSTGTSVAVSTFQTNIGQHEGSALVDCAVPLEKSIDIKPGSDPNTINPKGKGTIPVAILSSTTFDATNEVDKTSLTFGRTGDETSLAFCTKSDEDVNGDGLLDIVCHFHAQLTGFQVGDTEGVLKGKTVGGLLIEGRDSVRIVN